MIECAAVGADLELKAHPHMLQHAAAMRSPTKVTTPGQSKCWLGHRSITSTADYTALAPNRFKAFWREGAGSVPVATAERALSTWRAPGGGGAFRCGEG